MNQAQIFLIAEQFDFKGQPISVTECTTGHINSTYFVDCSSEDGLVRYVMQIVNTSIFKKPDQVMQNILHILYVNKFKVVKWRNICYNVRTKMRKRM